MRYFISHLTPMVLALGLAMGVAHAGAGGENDPPPFKQFELTDKMVTSFIGAQKDLTPLVSQLMEAGETLDPALAKQLEDIAKKHGFANFAEFEDVGANITIVLDGFDRETGTFTDPIERMKKELEEIKGDNTIPEEDKKLAIQDLTEEIAASEPLEHVANVDVVKRHIDAIEELIPDDAGESGVGDDDDDTQNP